MKQLPLLEPESSWEPPSVMPSLAGASRLSIDVETKDPDLETKGPGVRRPDSYVVGLAVGTDTGVRAYLPVRHEEGPNLAPKQVFGWARKAFATFTGEVVGTNLLYDLDFLAEEDVHFPTAKRFVDVQIVASLLDAHRRRYALDALAKDWLNEGKPERALREAASAWGFKKPKDVKKNLWRLPPRHVGTYAEGDVDLPLRLYELMFTQLRAEDLLDTHEVECDLIPMLLAMRRRGVAVDVSAAEEARQNLLERSSAELAHFKRLTGYAGDTPWEGDTLGVAFEGLGLYVPRTPKTNQHSVTKAWLAEHADVNAVQALQRARSYDKTAGTLRGHVIESAVNGRVHCLFHNGKTDEGGTHTGRFSSSLPNLQQIPSRDEEAARTCRGVFLPEDGEDWYCLDYSQIEFRLLVHYAVGEGADEARTAYRDDPDTSFHVLAAELAGLDPTDKPVYKRVKNTNFCKVYGGGATKVAETAQISVEEAIRFVNEYDARLPFVKKTYELADRRASRRGYITDIAGRRHRYPFFEPTQRGYRGPRKSEKEARETWGARIRRADTWKSLNHLLQGGAAGIMKRGMRDVWKSGVIDVLGVPLLTVHDELDLSVPRTKAGREAVAEVARLMERAVTLNVPIKVDVESGPTWGTVE